MTDLAVIENTLKPMMPLFERVTAPLRHCGVDPARIMQSVLISCDRQTQLRQCTLESIIQAATTGAMLGLEADGVTGQGFLIPFRQKGIRKAQWVTGYKGYNSLAARNGLTINADVVREGDKFDYEEGSSGYVRFKRLLNKPGRRIIAAWATASAQGRPAIVKVMDFDEILAVKAKSRAAKKKGGDDEDGEGFSPWNDALIGIPAMAAKTVQRRLQRFLPLSSFVHAAIIDEAHEERGCYAYMHPDRGVVIDGDETAHPLVPGAQPGPATGPTIEQIQTPSFIITGGRTGGNIVLPTIQQWRARWLDMISALKPAAAQKLYDRNAPLFDEYSGDKANLMAVREVINALQQRCR